MSNVDKSTFQRFSWSGEFVDSDYGPSGSNTAYREYLRAYLIAGSDVPNWRSLIRSGSSAMGSVTAYFSETKGSSGNLEHTQVYPEFAPELHYRSVKHSAQGQFMTLPDITYASQLEEAVNQAKSRFVSRANEALSPFQAMTFLGELLETIEMVLNPARSLKRGITSYLETLRKSRRGFSKASRKRKEEFIGGTWLEYSFGWAPFISDIDSGMKALAAYVTGRPPRIEIRAGGKAQQYVATAGASFGFGPVTFSYDYDYVDETKCEYYGAVDLPSGSDATSLHLFGWRPDLIVPTIWNLIPGSFLVDYFANIGTIIEAASFITSRLAYYGSSTQAIRRCTARYGADLTDRTPPQYEWGQGCTGGSVSPGAISWESTVFTREITPSLIPSLSLQLPLSLTKIANLAALTKLSRSMSPY